VERNLINVENVSLEQISNIGLNHYLIIQRLINCVIGVHVWLWLGSENMVVNYGLYGDNATNYKYQKFYDLGPGNWYVRSTVNL
jgi:hypothetical protein